MFRLIALVCLLLILSTANQIEVSAQVPPQLDPLQLQRLTPQQRQRLRQARAQSQAQAQSTALQDQAGSVKPPASVPEEELVTIDDRQAVFGEQIFTGQFAQQSFIGFNPDYVVATGDEITINLWGSVEQTFILPVDDQGNVFIPQIGPVKVRGVRNADLNQRIVDAIATTFTKNVGVYASLATAVPVKVFVTGFVKQPGLYAGHASDSVLYFLDSAGGVDPSRGSFLDIEVIRQGTVLRQINLYDFLMRGIIPLFQIADGDTIVVKPAKARAGVLGQVQNEFLFEFEGDAISVDELLQLARPAAQATHVRINRNSAVEKEVEYLPLEAARASMVLPGDVLEVTSDKVEGTISVRVEGEHFSDKEFILPYGANLGTLLRKVNFGENAQEEAIQLFRESVKERQKETLAAQLRALEQSVLTAQSNTQEEALLRTQEAQLVLQWVERARDIEPLGQVNVGGSDARNQILLEPGDVIRIPRTSKLIMVHGEVLFPSAMTYEDGMTVEDYIDKSGGFTQGKGSANVLLLHRDGTFDKITSGRLDSKRIAINPGDEIFVLPKVSTKTFQLAKDIIQILYSLALSAGVVLRL